MRRELSVTIHEISTRWKKKRKMANPIVFKFEIVNEKNFILNNFIFFINFVWKIAKYLEEPIIYK